MSRTAGFAVADSQLMVLSTFVLPAAAAVTCACWMLFSRQSLDGPHFLLALVACLAAGEAGAPSPRTETSSLTPDTLLSIASRWALVVLVLWAGVELSGLAPQLNVPVMVGAAVSMPVVLWLARSAVSRSVARRAAAAGPTTAVVVGVTEIGARWEASLAGDAALGIRVMAFFDDRDASRFTTAHTAPLAGGIADVADFVRANGVGIVYITLPISREPPMIELVESLHNSTVSIYFVPDVFAFDPVQARIECIHGIPLLAVCESPFYGPAALAKRAVDVMVSAFALAILAVPMLVLAILVKTTSSGPAIFKQRRYGLDGEDIVVLKFRTMTVTEDGASSYTQVQRGDARVTAVGAFLRATSLDELPQLINVLQGSMSIVGPRPHAIAVNEQYRRLIPSYMLRHKVKPGITGLAQVRGFRGGDDLDSMTQRIQCDLAYLRHWSLRLDFTIMARTAMLVLADRNAF